MKAEVFEIDIVRLTIEMQRTEYEKLFFVLKAVSRDHSYSSEANAVCKNLADALGNEESA